MISIHSLVFAANLFDLEKTLTRPLFEEVTYAWEVLPRIKDYLLRLARELPGDFERVDEFVWIGKGTTVESTALVKGPAIIGYDCEIRHGAYIREHVIVGNGVVLGNSSEMKNAIVFDDAQVPHFNYVGDSVLGYKAHLGAGVIVSNLKLAKDPIKIIAEHEVYDTGLRKFGALVGDKGEVGCNAVLNPGTIIGRESVVYALTNARGIVPEKHILKNNGQLVPRT